MNMSYASKAMKALLLQAPRLRALPHVQASIASCVSASAILLWSMPLAVVGALWPLLAPSPFATVVSGGPVCMLHGPVACCMDFFAFNILSKCSPVMILSHSSVPSAIKHQVGLSQSHLPVKVLYALLLGYLHPLKPSVKALDTKTSWVLLAHGPVGRHRLYA